MKNFEIAKILEEIAVYLEMDNVQFKPRAYEKAAKAVEALDKPIEEIYRKGGKEALMEIPGVGESIAEKIAELLTTGKLKYYEELKQKVPVDLGSFQGIEGLGPKKIKVLWQKLKIRNIDELEKAAREHKVCNLPGFKEKTEENILKGIEFARKSKGRYILGFTLPLIREIESRLNSLPEVKRAVVAGSVRRMKETIGDVDFLVISDKPSKVMDFFVSMPEVVDVMGKGETKSSVKLSNGMDADLRVVPEESFGAALQYFTGSKDHNIALRRIAIEKGWKLSEYGLFDKKGKQIAGSSEEEVYEKLGLQWTPPEMRENTGEVELAAKGRLPTLIGYKDLRGDLQVHSNWTDGANSIREMAEEAKKLGLEYIVISDHAKSLAMTGGLDEKAMLKQGKEINRVNEQLEGIRILKGVEANILKDGSLDLPDSILKQLEFVAVGVHSHFNMSKEEMTKRIIKAMENEHVDYLCHPTGREIQKREPYPVDVQKIIEVAKATGTVLDIDAYPDRLDLKDEHIRFAAEIGAKLGISSDAHSKVHLHFLEFGIAQARRGWATAKDIINTLPVNKLLKVIK